MKLYYAATNIPTGRNMRKDQNGSRFIYVGSKRMAIRHARLNGPKFKVYRLDFVEIPYWSQLS